MHNTFSSDDQTYRVEFVALFSRNTGSTSLIKTSKTIFKLLKNDQLERFVFRISLTDSYYYNVLSLDRKYELVNPFDSFYFVDDVRTAERF